MKNSLAEAKPMTVGVFLLTALWAVFQWRDPTPPPVLDQILVAAFGIWFANQAVSKGRTVKVGKDGEVSISEVSDDEPPEDDTDAAPKKDEGRSD